METRSSKRQCIANDTHCKTKTVSAKDTHRATNSNPTYTRRYNLYTGLVHFTSNTHKMNMHINALADWLGRTFVLKCSHICWKRILGQVKIGNGGLWQWHLCFGIYCLRFSLQVLGLNRSPHQRFVDIFLILPLLVCTCPDAIARHGSGRMTLAWHIFLD